MQIKTVPLSTLKPNPDNPRKASEEDLEALKKSLETYGWLQPLVIKQGIVIDGNHRLKVAAAIGITEAPVVEIPPNLTPQQEYELIFRINRHYAEYDEERVKLQLENDFPDLIDNATLAELGIDFLDESDFEVAEAPPPEEENKTPADLTPKQAIKAAMSKIVSETKDQTERGFAVFIHGGNKYLVANLSLPLWEALYLREAEDRDSFHAWIEKSLSVTLEPEI